MTKRILAATFLAGLAVSAFDLSEGQAQSTSAPTTPPANAATPPAPVPAATPTAPAPQPPEPAVTPAPAPAAAPQPAPAAPPPAASAEVSTSSGASVDIDGFGSSETPNSHAISLGLLAGAGFALDDTVGNVNAEGFGLGAQAGYNLDALFLGARFMYYFGGSSALPTGKLSMSTWLAAAEGGYDFKLSSLILRPSLALGLISRSVDQPPMFTSGATGGFIGGSGGSSPQLAFYAAPGASLLLPISILYLGADFRVPLAIGNRSYLAMDFLGTVGVRL